jgi:hypothetical protein
VSRVESGLQAHTDHGDHSSHQDFDAHVSS